MTENDSTDGARPVKRNSGPVLRTGEVLTRRQLMKDCRASRETFERWRAKGLEPLETYTKDDLYSTDEVIAIWKIRDKPKKGKRK